MPTAIEELLARSRAMWRLAAPAWTDEGDLIAASTRPVTEALVEIAAPRPGTRVLDVAGGTGDPTAQLAAAVGARGRVVCSDLTPAMLAGARRRLGALPVLFAAASAEALPFLTASFDAVVSRFGVMLFADPAAGVREMVRVLRPGGTVAAAVWGEPARNPYLALPVAASVRVAGIPPADPNAPGVFRLAAPGRLAELFVAAGAKDVREERRAFVMEGPLALDDFWPFLLRMAAPHRAAVQSLPPDVQARLAAAVRDDVRPYFASGSMRFPAEMVVVRATAH
jgi:SAM-dependent methyltransferase